MQRSLVSALFLILVTAACGPSYPQPYYEQQPVVVPQSYPAQQVYPMPIVIPITPHQPYMVPNTVTTTERRVTVSPQQVQQQPVQPRTTMQASQYGQQAAPATQNLGDRSGMVQKFQVQQGAQPRATGFGARRDAPPAASMTPAARPKTQFRAPSSRR